ncbi:MAG: 50S ribosomal protein L10 [Alphaproteobacteria bacterium]|nr:50S ribosomal protein L10 [Alphaproteobacteria bacterium]
MNREEKAAFVEEIRGRFEAAPFVVLADFKGSTVAQMDALRRACEPTGSHFQVVKNTLSKRAIAGLDAQKLEPHFVGNVGVLFAGEDAIATAKMFKAQLKDNKLLVVKAGLFEGDVLDEKGVEAVAELPSREDLLATLLSTIQEGPRQLLGVIQGAPRDLLYLLQNYASELEKQG